jgi:hypothetical protein
VERVNVWTMEEPLFFNGLLSIELLNSVTLRNNLIKAGICKIGHLKINNQWITAEELHLKTDIRSLRVLQRFLEEIKSLLDLRILHLENFDGLFPEIRVFVEVGDWEETEGSLLTCRTPEPGNFELFSKKALYMICVKALNLRVLDKVIESKWIGEAEQGSSPKGSWRSLYKKPIE